MAAWIYRPGGLIAASWISRSQPRAAIVSPRGSQEVLDIPRQFAANCASQHIESRQRKASMGSNYKAAQGSGSEKPAMVMPAGLTICLPETNESGILGRVSIVGRGTPCGSLAALAHEHEHAMVRLEE